MTDQHLLEQVLHQQKEQAKDLKDIKTTLQTIGIQDERIRHCENQNSTLFTKYDNLMGTNGLMIKIREHQASCPREEVKNLKIQLWTTIIGFSLACLTLAFKVYST